MPKDNIERAIKRGAGEDKDGVVFEEITFEGYGPHGSALMVTCVTDNRNRTVPDMRHAFSKYGGNMAEPGAVGWQFDRKSYFAFPSSELSFDKAFELGIEAGADDVVDVGDTVEIYAPVELFKAIADSLHQVHVHTQEAGLRMVPKQEIELDVESTLKFMRMVEAIEELDDVQDVFHNVNVSDEALAALEAA
jgi:YebC/PmpR family DNA-binding regulatory protein